jgi:hypothetical protein
LRELDFQCWWGAYDDLLDCYEYELYQEEEYDRYGNDTGDSGCDSDGNGDDSAIEDDEASDDEDRRLVVTIFNNQPSFSPNYS